MQKKFLEYSVHTLKKKKEKNKMIFKEDNRNNMEENTQLIE